MIWAAMCATTGPPRGPERDYHVPVLKDEVLSYLLHDRSRVVLDGTLGAGGHAMGLLEADHRLELVGVDRDHRAIEIARGRLSRFGDRVTLIQGLYSDLGAILGARRVDGVLLDLGVSSMQIDRSDRGFGYRFEAPLDMRMGGDGETATELLSRLDVHAVAELLRSRGEVSSAGAIARAIERRARRDRMKTTADLRSAVSSGLGRSARPSELSRVFQAVRIAVNSELEQLDDFLHCVLDFLNPRARLAIISYHSLEDRRVKTFFKEKSASCVCPPEVPICVCGNRPALRVLTRRAVRPSEIEIDANSRARSARMRVAEFIEESTDETR